MKKFVVLVIDDQIDSRNSLAEILVSNDFIVTTANTDEKVYECLNNEVIDLIFICSGYSVHHNTSFCRTIKGKSAWTTIPVIFILDHYEQAIVREIYESGCDDYILKPIVWNELMMKSRIHLELKYSRQMARSVNQILESKVEQRTHELEASLTKLVQANKDLEILEIAKSEFFNMISHEIRTPLNGILGSLALIDRFTLSEKVKRYFSILDLSVKRLEKFSNTILEASTLRIKGEKALRFEDADILVMFNYIVNQHFEQISAKSITIDLKNNLTNSVLRCDKKYLSKCLEVVLDNAVKFSPTDSIIDVELFNDTEHNVKITIADSGSGFSESSLSTIFNAMGNLKAHFDKNIGMGLHMAKLITDAHSGSIKAGNRSPNGAIIEICFPKSRS